MALRLSVILAILVASSAAHADAWYFEWRCAGACAPNRLDVSGQEGPFSSESGCDRARSQRLSWALGPGNAGSATSCANADGGAGPTGSSGAPVRPARFSRAFFGMTAASGFAATYANGTRATADRQFGGEIEPAFGYDRFGVGLILGVARDDGTSPGAMTVVEPMWLAELGIGLISSPFAVMHSGSLEIRPELGAYIVDVERVGCTRCDGDPIAGTPGEASGGFGTRLRVGVDVYFGPQHSHGLAIDALFQFVQLGNFNDETAPTSVELRAPRLMLRVSWIPVRNE